MPLFFFKTVIIVMTEVALLAIVALTAGLIGFLAYLSFLAHSNNSKNLKKDYLVNESEFIACRYRHICNKRCRETNEMLLEEDSRDIEETTTKEKANVSKIVKVNGIGKNILNKETDQ